MKLSRVQQETLDALKGSQWGYLTVEPGCVQPRTAEALVKRGLAVWDWNRGWGDQSGYRVIRLPEPEVV